MTRLTPPKNIDADRKRALVEPLLAAVEGLRVVHNALQQANPADTDYGSAKEYLDACEAWADRLTAVERLSDELLEQAMRVTLG